MSYDEDITQEELEQVERYLQNEMSHDEAEAFATKIGQNENLSRKVNEVRLTILGIREAALSERLDHYHDDVKQVHKKESRRMLFPGKWAIAASVAVIVALSAWWISQRTNTDQRLYSAYYRPDPGLMTLMSSETSSYTFEKAMVEYKNGEYDKALKAWGTLLSKAPHNDTLLYFIGAASQAKSDETAAIEYLQQVAADSNSVFQKDAFWYLGLAYLNIGEKRKAIDNLERSEHPQSIALIDALTQ